MAYIHTYAQEKQEEQTGCGTQGGDNVSSMVREGFLEEAAHTRTGKGPAPKSWEKLDDAPVSRTGQVTGQMLGLCLSS